MQKHKDNEILMKTNTTYQKSVDRQQLIQSARSILEGNTSTQVFNYTFARWAVRTPWETTYDSLFTEAQDAWALDEVDLTPYLPILIEMAEEALRITALLTFDRELESFLSKSITLSSLRLKVLEI